MKKMKISRLGNLAAGTTAFVFATLLVPNNVQGDGAFYTFDETVEAVEPGSWNQWDFSSEAVIIGWDNGNQATVTIEPGGELLAGQLILGGASPTASGFLVISGVTDEEEPRPATFRQSPMSGGFETFIGRDGHGEVTVSNGGLFSTRVNYTAERVGSTGKVTITGPGSLWDVNDVTLRVGQLGHGILQVLDGGRVENFTNAFIGNIRSQQDEVTLGAGSAEVLIGGGGSIANSGYIRFGNHEETNADVIVTGAGSAILPGTYFQVGFNGSASLLVTDGGRVEIPLDEGSNSSIGRNEPGSGQVTIEGEGSFIQVPRLLVGSDTVLNPTGFGTLLIRDQGELILGGLLGLRNGSSVELDNGIINLVGGINALWPDVIDVQGENTRIFGTGIIKGNVLIGGGGTITGTGDGIEIEGVLLGGGFVENLTIGGVRVATATGSLALSNVAFEEDSVVEIAINDFSDANNLLTLDSNTSLAGTHLEVTISVVIEDPEWTAQILPLGLDHGFASVTLPDGWALEDGLLRVEGDGPPPPPPLNVSIYTGEAEGTDNWVHVNNWDTDFFPDGPLDLAQFSQPVNTDRINMLATSPLLTIPTVHQAAGILVMDGYVANPVSDGNFLFRNSSTGTPGFLRLHGFDTTIGGEPATGLVVNHSDQNISFSTVNASFQIELAASGLFHVEKPDTQTRVIVGITELEGTSHGITKTGAGILHFGAQSQNSDFSGGFILEEGVVQWTNSGSAGSVNPFGLGSLTIRGGNLRSTSNTGRLLNTSIILDGIATIGSLEDGFLGQITVNSGGGSLLTTISSDSTLNILSPAIWHQGTNGDGSLNKTGPDTLVFTGSGGTVNHTGPTSIAEGMLRLNADINNSPVTVRNGGSLGFGLVGETGRGVVNSSLTLEEGSSLVFRLDEPDTENPENHDSLQVSGALNLGGGELVIELGYTPNLSDSFLLIENWTWTPAGLLSHNGVLLTEGSQFSVFSGEFSQLFEITYVGGSGFDVVITALGEADETSLFQQWAASFGLTGEDAAPDANPAGDGFSNAQKFAFGINPTVAVAALGHVSGDGESVTLRWNRSTNAGISYVIEFRGSLTEGDWAEVEGAIPSVMAEPDLSAPDGYERVEWSAEIDGGSGFYRARAVIGAALLP